MKNKTDSGWAIRAIENMRHPFWGIRNCKAVLNGLRHENGSSLAPQIAIRHIMDSLNEIERALVVEGYFRCNRCGKLNHDNCGMQLLGERFCLECGTATVEFLSEDEGLRTGMAEDLARQADAGGKFQTGLFESYQAGDPNHQYWHRIVLAAPEVGQAWLNRRNRIA